MNGLLGLFLALGLLLGFGFLLLRGNRFLELHGGIHIVLEHVPFQVRVHRHLEEVPLLLQHHIMGALGQQGQRLAGQVRAFAQAQGGSADHSTIPGPHLLGLALSLRAGDEIFCFNVSGHGTGPDLIPLSALSVHRVQNGGRAVVVDLAGHAAGGIRLGADIHITVHLGHRNVVIGRGLGLGGLRSRCSGGSRLAGLPALSCLSAPASAAGCHGSGGSRVKNRRKGLLRLLGAGVEIV